MARLPEWVIDDLWAYAMEDQDPTRQARVIDYLGTQRRWQPPAARSGRPSLDDRLWCARAVAAVLVPRFHDRDQGTLAEAAAKALALWPRRGAPPPSVDTLLSHHRFFRRQMNRMDNRGWRSAAVNAAARYYSALSAFTQEATTKELKALLVHYVGFI
jgi:hypothetical protein